ncbi:MAG: N-acetylmuramoyl-L-alanine amidase, partial [Oxalobacteraceae bacterium]
GYSLDDPAATLRAFHHHYRGSEARTLDAEDLRILHALTGSLRPLRPPVSVEQLESEGS